MGLVQWQQQFCLEFSGQSGGKSDPGHVHLRDDIQPYFARQLDLGEHHRINLRHGAIESVVQSLGDILERIGFGDR